MKNNIYIYNKIHNIINMNSSNQYMFKVIVVGDSNVGKSSISSRYVDKYFNDTYSLTYGIDFKVKTLTLNNTIVKLQLWDTAGQEKFHTIIRSYYKCAAGVLIVFDLTNIESFNNISYWLSDVNTYLGDDVSILIIGAKMDLYKKIVVTSEMIDDIKKKYKYIEVSSKTGENIDNAFDILANDMLLHANKTNIYNPSIKLAQPMSMRTKKCC